MNPLRSLAAGTAIAALTLVNPAANTSAAQIAVGAPVPITGIENAFPAWSPDGTKILFQSNRSGEWNLYVMNPDGSGVKDLTPSARDTRNPSFSPDGSRIVFYSSQSGNDEIYVMNADGSGMRNVTNNPASDIHPHWTPDGRKIVFNSLRDDPDGYDIYEMNADGSGVRRVTDTRDDETCAQISPDGTRMIFLRSYARGGSDIFLTDRDGKNPVNVSGTPEVNDGWPSWSPDGKRILYSSAASGRFVVFVVNADGTERRPLTDGAATQEDARAVFSPDGSRIAFTRRSGRSMDIYVMPASR